MKTFVTMENFKETDRFAIDALRWARSEAGKNLSKNEYVKKITLETNLKIMITAIRTCSDAFKYASKKLKENKKVVFAYLNSIKR